MFLQHWLQRLGRPRRLVCQAWYNAGLLQPSTAMGLVVDKLKIYVMRYCTWMLPLPLAHMVSYRSGCSRQRVESRFSEAASPVPASSAGLSGRMHITVSGTHPQRVRGGWASTREGEGKKRQKERRGRVVRRACSRAARASNLCPEAAFRRSAARRCAKGEMQRDDRRARWPNCS